MTVDLGFYWALFLRRVPVMILFVLLFSGMGIIAALKLPDVYSTSARLLVDEPQIPDSMVSSTVRIGAVEQLEIIEQRLLTRANLVDIANRFDVFEGISQMAPDNVVAGMREATTIRRTRDGGGQRATLMIISFDARSPRIAAAVVNEYVTLVLEENAKFRVSRAENTLEFFEQEVERLSNNLDSQSAEIARFKAENSNALPQNETYRLGRQAVLQDRLDQLKRDLQTTKQKRANVLRTFETTGSLVPRAAGARSAYEEELIISRAELKNLREDYGEDNPRIIRLNNRIDRLEAIVGAQSTVGTSRENEQAEQGAAAKASLDATLAEIDSETEALQAMIDNTTAEIEELMQNISKSTPNAIRLAEMERDQSIIQTRYASAVANLNAARMSERLEATARGQRISVIENANVPNVPSGPDRPIIAAAAILVGLGLAVGYFFLLELLNRVIRRPAELVERFDTEPIATIPYMESRKERLLRRTGMVTTTFAVLIAVPAGLWYVDTNYLPLEVIVQKGLSKFGLG